MSCKKQRTGETQECLFNVKSPRDDTKDTTRNHYDLSLRCERQMTEKDMEIGLVRKNTEMCLKIQMNYLIYSIRVFCSIFVMFVYR